VAVEMADLYAQLDAQRGEGSALKAVPRRSK
jgi:hypothetical protein